LGSISSRYFPARSDETPQDDDSERSKKAREYVTWFELPPGDDLLE
jgi:hypothetical protein